MYAPVPLADGAVGWVGLGTLNERDGSHTVDVYVGVRHEHLQRLLGELDPEAGWDECSASATRSLTSLVPGDRAFEWFIPVSSSEEYVREVVSRVADGMEEYGYPYMRELAVPESLFEELWDQRRDYVMGPVASLIVGDPRKGISIVRDEAARLAASEDERTGPWGRRYAAFAPRFLSAAAKADTAGG